MLRNQLLGDTYNTKNTKDRIMLDAAVLFAQRGYAAITMKDIAKQVNISPSAIYNHFENKEALYDAIVENIKEVYMNFYGRLGKVMESATCFADVVEGLFAELKKVYQIYIYYGYSLITTEQFREPKAGEIFNDVFLKHGTAYSKAQFDACIERGWVKEFDTEALAMLFNHSVVVGTLLRTHEHLGRETAYDPTEMFTTLERYVISIVEVIDG